LLGSALLSKKVAINATSSSIINEFGNNACCACVAGVWNEMMKQIELSGLLLNPSPGFFENIFFEYQCGNGPKFLGNPFDAVVPVTTTSAVINLKVALILPSGDKFESNVKLRESDEIQSVDINIPLQSTNVAIRVSFKFSQGDITHIANILSHGNVISILSSFYNEVPEDLSLRFLSEQGHCVGMTTMTNTGMAIVVLHHEFENLELSVAGKTFGVCQIPIEFGLPMIVSFEGDSGGSIILCLNSMKRKCDAFEAISINTVQCEALLNRQLDYQSNLAYHLEILLSESQQFVGPNDSLICSGVVTAPLLSRLELPHPPTTFIERTIYSLPATKRPSSSHPLTISLGHGVLLCPRDVGLGSKGIDLRLSILRLMPLSPHMGQEPNPLNESSAILLASCLLKETERIPISNDDKVRVRGESDAINVLFWGQVDVIRDHPDNPFSIGQKVSISTCLFQLPNQGNVSSEAQSSSLVEKEPMPMPPSHTSPEAENALPSLSELADISHLAQATLELGDSLPIALSVSPSRQVLSTTSSRTHLQSPVLHQSGSNLLGQSLSESGSGGGGGGGGGGGIIQLLSAELKEKQRIIDRLMNDNALKSEVSLVLSCYV
jgi:hypothetical protein